MSLSYRNKRIKRIFSKGTHRSYWEKHADCEQYLKTWYNTAMNADWKSPSDVKETYASASILKQRRIVFNIKGNTYRLITKINFEKQWMFIRFIGTHAEYDKIDVEKIMTMNIKPIKSENDYQEALQRLDELFDAKIGTSESDEADTLALLIDNYENQHYPIESPDPIEAIRIRMEEMHIKQVDLIPEIGGKSRVSEVLNKNEN